MKALLLLTTLASLLGSADGKIRRVKAGQHYKTHDAVHLVVNKVGYVIVVLLRRVAVAPVQLVR